MATSVDRGEGCGPIEPLAPAPSHRAGSGFTLIELLVVVAIVALLLALLVPWLQKAKEIAIRALCAANCRNIGTAVAGFASEHDGRGPGHGCYGPRSEGPWVSHSSISWPEILNTEWYKESRVQRMGPAAGKNRLYCPSMRLTNWGPWVRGHYLNRDVGGGPNWQSNPRAGVYGLELDVRELESMYPRTGNGDLNGYALGARLERFRTPSELYLLLETEAGDDSFGAMPGALYQNDPPWLFRPNAGGYGFSYRHVLPADESLYKTGATANFLYLDAHVEVHTPVNTDNERYRFEISY